MKSVSFARVSSKDQEIEGYSLPSQEKLFQDYSQRKAFDVVRKFSVAESASGRKQRKIFNEMIDYVRKNKINIIICEKVDRLTRNLKDALAINDWLEENTERQVHFVKQNLVIHKNAKSDEKFRWDIEVVLARKTINNLSEEVKKGQKEKLAQGWSPQGEPPLGYKTTGEKGHKTHIIDRERAPLIKKMFELYSTGNYPLTTLANTMKKEGLRNNRNKPVSRSRIHGLLSNPFYIGINKWNGEIHNNAKQEIFIGRDLFNLVQDKLSIKFGGKPKYSKHNYIFKAKVKCEECGGTIAWEMQKGQLYGYCNRYKPCSQKSGIKQYEVEDQLLPLLTKVAPKNEHVLKWLEKALKESRTNETDYNTNKREELTKVIKTADKRIEGAYTDKLDGKMPVELCEKIIKESTAEKHDALDSLSKLTESRAAYYEAGYSIHELALRAQNIYKSQKATLEDKRLLLSYVFSNLTLNKGIVRAEYTLAFQLLLNWMPKVNSTFELAEKASFKHKTEVDASVCTVMRGRWDLNPRSLP